MYKKISLGVFFLSLFLLVAFKPLSQFGAELYLSYKLKAPVTIENYQLFPLNADLLIANLNLEEQQVKDVKTNLKLMDYRVITVSSFENEKVRTKDLSFDYDLKSGDFQAKSTFEIVGFDSLKLQTKGNYQADNLHADINGTFYKKSDFNFVANLNREGNVTKVDLDANTFGGVLELAFVQNRLILLAKSLELSQILKEFKQEPIAQGSLNLKASVELATLKTELSIDSKKIEAFAESFEDVNFVLKDFNYKNKIVDLKYGLNFSKNEKQLHFDGSANYRDSLKLTAETDDFGGKITFVLDDQNITFDALHVPAQNLLVFLKEKEYISGVFDLSAHGDFKNIDIKLEAPQLQTSKELLGDESNVSIKLLANYTPEKVTFSPSLKSSLLELDTGEGSYDIEKKSLSLNQDIRVKYKEIDATLYVKLSYKDKILQAQTASLGGKTTIVFQENNLHVELQNLYLKTLDRMFLHKDVLQKGTLSGTLLYNIESKKGKSELHVKDGLVSGVDLDAELGTLMNAVGLNIFSLKDELFADDKSVETKITHLEFDATLEDGKVHLVDSAFATQKFRIAALGDFNQSGKIEELNLNLLDKNGCSIIKQEISGTLSKPILENKILTTTDVIVSIPSEILKNPKKLLEFSTNLVDKTATFLLGLTHLSDAKVTLTSDISTGALNLVEDTSKIVLRECKVVYDGKVKAIETKR